MGEVTESSKYFVSNSFVEKIFDNIRTNTLEFEQRIEAKVEVIGENMKRILDFRKGDNRVIARKIHAATKYADLGCTLLEK